MKKILLPLVLLSFLAFRIPALADEEVRKLMLDLTAKGFTQTQYVDNLDSSNIIFGPGDKFQLRLKISNEGNRNQTQVVVRQTLPSSITTDSPVEFTIPQIPAGEDYIKNITVTVKDKTNVYQALTKNSLRFTAKSEIGTEGGDYLAFYTNNGTKSTSASTTPTLPATGAASTLLFGSAIASALGFAGLKLRALARGY